MIYIKLFLSFFKIGLFTIGGGYAMIPLITSEVSRLDVGITQEQLTNFIAISESTPGPFAINIATFVGIQSTDIFGAILSTVGVIMPSFIIILIIAKYFTKFSDNRYVKAGLMGIRPVVVGLISSVVFTIALSNFFVGLDNITGNFFANNINYKEIMIFALVLIASQIKIKGKKLHPIVLIILSALLGILLFGVM